MDVLNMLDDIELVCVALALDTSKKRKRVHWVHPLNSHRLSLGEFNCLYSNIRQHPDRFFNYYRMSVKSFDELVILMRPNITKKNTKFRDAIGVEERLTVTIR